ncbi:MAG: hypothetical protein ABIH67_02720, partial [Candidatus Uhrbacteria bacterium]
YTCESDIGYCNGGYYSDDENEYIYTAQPCIDQEYLVSSRACEYYPLADDSNSESGDCVTRVCDANCLNSCPMNYEEGTILISAEAEESTSDSIELYSWLSGSDPDTSTLYFPACSVATSLTADVSFENIEDPEIDIIILLDESGSMARTMDDAINCTNVENYCEGGVDDDYIECTDDSICSGVPCIECVSRAQVAHEVMGYAISEMFGTFEDGKLQIGITTFQTDVYYECFGGPNAGNSCVVGNGDCDDDNNILNGTGFCLENRTCSTTEVHEPVASEFLSSILSEVYSLNDHPVNGTPTVKGFDDVGDIFEDSTAAEKILIFIGDGAASNACDYGDEDYVCTNDLYEVFDGNTCDPDAGWVALLATCGAGGTCDSSESAYSVARDEADRLKDDLGVKIYTAAILTDDQSSDIGQMAHYSSEECEGLNYNARSDCESPTGVPYAYVAETATEFEEMFDAIIDAIRGISVTYTTVLGVAPNEVTIRNSGLVLDGIGLPIPLPAGFECDDEEIGVPFRVEFSGTGPVTLENITVEYCPLW